MSDETAGTFRDKMSDAPGTGDLQALRGDPNALTTQLFNAWAEELPDDLAQLVLLVLKVFLDVHFRSRLGALFKLPIRVAIQAIRDAGVNEPDAFLLTLEETAGFKFKRDDAPESANLVIPHSRVSPSESMEEKSHRKRKRTMTVGERLQREGTLEDEELPEGVFKVINTADPKNNTISEPELEAWTTAVIEVCVGRYGELSLGRALCMHFGRLGKKRLYKLPDYGDKLGKDRDLGKMLWDKCRNIRDVRSPHPLSFPSSPPAHRFPPTTFYHYQVMPTYLHCPSACIAARIQIKA